MNVLRLTWLLLRKDLVVHARTREVPGLMLLFAVLCVVVFAFAFLRSGDIARTYVPGVLWVTLLFSGTVGLLRLFGPEEEGGALELVSRTSAGALPLFLSKVALQFLFSGLVTALVVPLTLVFFATDLVGGATIAAALLLGLVGQAVLGTLCSALMVQVRLREVLLPLVLYPVMAPVLLAGVKVTALALNGGDPAVIAGWLELMVGFDVIFLFLAPWLHGRVAA